MVGGEGDAKRGTQDQGTVVDLLNDKVEPGMKLFIVHLELIGTCN